ncbi:hypothetical protein [Flavobacterium sp.]|uniref:hypothetical protein n=1 Tax=Flavobacterium sp. TaxID=239 RepID=UPI002FDCEA94
MTLKLFSKTTYISFIFTFFFTSLLAQNKENNFIVTLAPLALIDIYDGASVRIGSEIKLHQNVSFGLEGGSYLTYLKSTKINPNGYLIRPIVKYYLNKQNCFGKYIALEYQYKNQTYEMRDSIRMEADTYEKQYGMKRIIHSAVFKYGNLKNIGENFLLEWYCGIGIRHIRSFSNLTGEESDGILTGEEGDCPIQEDIIRLTGTRIFPDFRLGIKLGFRLK